MRPFIKTDRLILRKIGSGDAAAISKLAGDPDIARMTGSFPHPFPLLSAEVKVMILKAMRRQNNAYPYAITVDGGSLLGMVDIFRNGPGFPFELGYWLGKPYWGKGYAAEASTAILQEAKNTLRLTEIVAGVFFDNPSSVRVLEKLGFEACGPGDDYFSMARLKKASSLDFRLSLDASSGQRSCAAG